MGRREAHRPCRAGEGACASTVTRSPRSAPSRHFQASRSMGVAPSAPGRVSGNPPMPCGFGGPVQRAPRGLPL